MAVIFCGTFPHLSVAGRYPAGCPVLSGLSSLFQRRQPSLAAGKDNKLLMVYS